MRRFGLTTNFVRNCLSDTNFIKNSVFVRKSNMLNFLSDTTNFCKSKLRFEKSRSANFFRSLFPSGQNIRYRKGG